MLIQEQMGFKGLLCFIALVLFLTFAAAGSEGNKRTDETNRGMVEPLGFNSRLELIHAKKGFKDLELTEKLSRSNGIFSRSGLPANGKKQKATCFRNPHVKQTILDCLRMKNNHFHISGEESGSNNKVYSKYLGPRFDRFDVPRQRKLLENLPEVPALSAAVGSPVPSLEPFPVPAPSSSRVPSSQQPNESIVKPFPPESRDLGLQPTAGGYASAVQSPSTSPQPSKKNSSRKSVVIAVIVTAPVTFFVTVLLFLCYLKRRRTGSEVGEKDERPLLSLSLSSYSVGNSIDNGKLGNQSLNSKSTNNQKVPSSSGIVSFGASDVAASALADVSSEVVPPLKPLPGGSSTSGLLPMNPSPSESDLSPPESPFLNPSAGKVSTPRSPPPIPTTSLQPSSGSLHPPPPPPPPPPLPAVPSDINTAHQPPPAHPKGGLPPPPPRPPAIGSRLPQPPPLGPSHPLTASNEGGEAVATKAKLKPFFWDKVLANPDHSMVWHQIKSGSFQFNEEMIETLFGYTAAEKNRNETKKESLSQDPPTQYIKIIDSKKSQNLSILLKALNVTTEEVCDAILEGNELPSELLQTLLKMAPTAEEELKLKLFGGELSKLGPAERFLKVLVDIPFAFKRLESLLFMCTLQEEGSVIKESFGSLEAACMELKKSRLFLKLLEAVLKTGNRMNDGTFRGGAQAFKLDTLLKLSDVKGVDGKTTLLHFVVQEIIRSEGVRAARAARESKSLSSFKSDNRIEDSSPASEEHYCNLGLQVVSGLSGELENVKKAAGIDADSLTGTVAKLSQTLAETREFLDHDMKNIDDESGFHQTLKNFVQNAEVDVMLFLEEQKRIMALVKNTTDYFHGNTGKDEGLRVFLVVRDFLIMLDKVCLELKNAPIKQNKMPSSESSTVPPASKLRQPPPNPHQWLFPAIRDRRIDDSSSDDDIC